MTSQLSWQPLPVTKCGECKYLLESKVGYQCDITPQHQFFIYGQNKDGITESCPMWQQQNKEMV